MTYIVADCLKMSENHLKFCNYMKKQVYSKETVVCLFSAKSLLLFVVLKTIITEVLSRKGSREIFLIPPKFTFLHHQIKLNCIIASFNIIRSGL